MTDDVKILQESVFLSNDRAYSIDTVRNSTSHYMIMCTYVDFGLWSLEESIPPRQILRLTTLIVERRKAPFSLFSFRALFHC